MVALTPLYDLHRSLGARLVSFAGYSMPLHYSQGILAEHHHTRSQASLFDVSHMGQIALTGSGSAAAAALETLTPADIIALPQHRQRYGIFTNHRGGIIDDWMVSNTGHGLWIVVNAACHRQDLQHLQSLSDRCTVQPLNDRALLALQGPQAGSVLTRINPAAGDLSFMTGAWLTLAGSDCWVTRSGYTGEDGFEISIPAESAAALAEHLIQQPEVAPAGLGARDSLRLEAGLCLYGHDIDGDTTPIEAGLSWVIGRTRRPDGERAGGFPGSDIVFSQWQQGVDRQRVGLRPWEKAPVREGSPLMSDEGTRLGHVTSGGFSPTMGAPVAMGYVTSSHTQVDTVLYTERRGKRQALQVTRLPFVAHRYHRS